MYHFTKAFSRDDGTSKQRASSLSIVKYVGFAVIGGALGVFAAAFLILNHVTPWPSDRDLVDIFSLAGVFGGAACARFISLH